MAKLADALASGASLVSRCRFKSCLGHHFRLKIQIRAPAPAERAHLLLLIPAGFAGEKAYKSPYIIQCDAGKKRTGFVCLILEMLSGTSYINIVNDYLESYKNNNGFLANPEIAKDIEVQKIQKLIYYINGNQDFEKNKLGENCI